MSNIDETELARLEELAAHYTSVVTLDNVSIPHQIIKAVPALVAEVRRLRRNYECSEKSLQHHEQMVADLMDKVEAWEWWDECRRCVEWLDETYCSNDTFSEAESTYLAAREAVHADRQ